MPKEYYVKKVRLDQHLTREEEDGSIVPNFKRDDERYQKAFLDAIFLKLYMYENYYITPKEMVLDVAKLKNEVMKLRKENMTMNKKIQNKTRY